MKPGDTYVTVQWPDSYMVQDLPTMFASMDVADRWIRAALLYALGAGHDWVLKSTDNQLIRRSAPQITCDQTESGAAYTGITTLETAHARPVKEAAYTSSGQRFDVVTRFEPGDPLLSTGRRTLHAYADVCNWTPPRIIGDADELPPFMQARRD
jgi:hypothetical protein